MVPFIFIRQDGIFRVQDGNCELIYDRGSSQYVDVAIKPDGKIYIGCMHEILLLDPANNAAVSIYTHTMGYIRRITIRRIASKNVLYFSSDNGGEVTIYGLKDDKEAVPYHTIDREDLMMPYWDSCATPPGFDPTHEEEPSMLSPSYFAFDQSENLFVSNGHQFPCGFYRYSGAGENEVTGAPERIHVSQNPCYGLVCRDSNTLYYIAGKDTESLYVQVRRVDLLPLPLTDEPVYSGSEDPDFNKDVQGFALIPDISGVNADPADIRWLQRSINVIFHDSPPCPVDGVLGPKTREMIKEFQQNNGLIPDGIAGPKTFSKIIEVLRNL